MRGCKKVMACLVLAWVGACGGGGGGNNGRAANPAPSPVAEDDGSLLPPAVAAMTLTQPASNTMVVAWSAPASSGGSAISGYRVSWVERGTGRSWQNAAPYPLSASPLTLTDLVPATEYEVSVAAINASGAGKARTAVLATLAVAPATPLNRIVAGYYPNWTPDPARIRDVDTRYNLIYLFNARPEGGQPGTTGAVYFDPPGNGRGAATNLVADIQYARQVQGRKIILSAGGDGNRMSFPTRQKSQNFVNSIIAIHEQLGGFDGLDLNTFEDGKIPDTNELIWISLELKRRLPEFIITAPPTPWNPVEQEFCRAMVAAGALDYAAPQYYSGPDLAEAAYLTENASRWVALLGQQHVVLGFGIWNQPYYMQVGEAANAWTQVSSQYPLLRGVSNWQIHTDEAAGWEFAKTVGGMVTQQ